MIPDHKERSIRPKTAVWGVLSSLAAAIALTGCAFERHYVKDAGVNQVLQVQSGDRWYMDLEENASTGYQWSGDCDDKDVEVKIAHLPAESELVGAPGKASVEVCVHRGFDGPSSVNFEYRRPWEKAPLRSFSLQLFKRTGDEGFWK